MASPAHEPRDMADFGSRFVESASEPIEHDGRLVQIAWILGPVPAGVLTLGMRAKGDLEQGVGISADGHASAGPGGPTFDDLVVDAAFEAD